MSVKKTFEDAGIPFASLRDICEEIFILVKFLQDKGMLVKPIVNSVDDITDDFELRSTQLTQDGVLFLRSGGYKKFINAKLKNKFRSLEKSYRDFQSLSDIEKIN